MRYKEVLSMNEVLNLLQQGWYKVCPKTAIVTTQGYEVQPFKKKGKEKSNRRYIRLYSCSKRKTITLARLVWMSVTKTVIPIGFEIHHLDRNCASDSWSNLLCVYKMDHNKLHAYETSEPIPF